MHEPRRICPTSDSLPKPPRDPFSSDTLKVKKLLQNASLPLAREGHEVEAQCSLAASTATHTGWLVYSVGPDLQDNGGDAEKNVAIEPPVGAL